MNEDTHSESALELRVRQLKKYMTLGIIGLLVLGILQIFYTASVKQNETNALTNSQVQAQTTKDSTICQTFPDDDLCTLAEEVLADPKQTITPKDGSNGTNGTNGKNGSDGRGVTKFDIVNGNLVVQYTDGVEQTIGKVVGRDGVAGATGATGAKGETGVSGKDGRGILSTGLESGSLIVRYSDGTTENLGYVVGPAGANGADGAPGKDGVGTTGATGATGPQGEQGPQGVAGPPGTNGISITDVQVDNTGTVVVYYSNNTSAVAGKVIVSSITSMVCDPNTDILTITISDGTAFTTTVDCSPDILPAAPNPSTLMK